MHLFFNVLQYIFYNISCVLKEGLLFGYQDYSHLDNCHIGQSPPKTTATYCQLGQLALQTTGT